MQRIVYHRKCNYCGREDTCPHDMIGPHFPGWGHLEISGKSGEEPKDICPDCMKRIPMAMPCGRMPLSEELVAVPEGVKGFSWGTQRKDAQKQDIPVPNVTDWEEGAGADAGAATDVPERDAGDVV